MIFFSMSPMPGPHGHSFNTSSVELEKRDSLVEFEAEATLLMLMSAKYNPRARSRDNYSSPVLPEHRVMTMASLCCWREIIQALFACVEPGWAAGSNVVILLPDGLGCEERASTSTERLPSGCTDVVMTLSICYLHIRGRGRGMCLLSLKHRLCWSLEQAAKKPEFLWSLLPPLLPHVSLPVHRGLITLLLQRLVCI